MAILAFTGDFVAAQFSIDGNGGGETDVTIGQTPFLSTDIVRIEIDDADIGPNGEFDPNEVVFLSFTVERDGTEYEFGVNSGSKIKESGGGSNAEQGDTYFLMNDAVSPPASGPFAGLDTQTYLFSSEQSFAAGPGSYTLTQTSDDAGGPGNSNFNAQSAPICFAEGTLIRTARGEMPIERLSVGDEVLTVDNGLQPVRYIHRTRCRFAADADRTKPVVIPAGALGCDMPHRDLVISPQHRVLVPQPPPLPMVLVPAKALCVLRGIRVMRGARDVAYRHLMLDRHEVIYANGAPTESFYPGPVALRSLDSAAYRAVRGIALQSGQTLGPGNEYPRARTFVRRTWVRNNLCRHRPVWTRDRLEALTGAAPPVPAGQT